MEKIHTMLINSLKFEPEERFILNCLRSELGEQGGDEFTRIDISTIDWDIVYENSVKWSIAPLLYKIIKKRSSLLQSSRISDYFIQKMRMQYIGILIQNEKIFERLNEVLEILNAAGIKAILLKGSHLGKFVYKDVAVRPMSDIDILIKKEDLQKCEELLVNMGYEFIQKYHDTQDQTSFIEQYKTNHYHLCPLSNPKGIKHLEIHWTIKTPTSSLKIDIEGLWERAEMIRINGTDALIFSPEDLISYLSLHACHQHKLKVGGLIPYCDIAATINHYNHEIDWEQLQIRANEWGIEKYLYLTLRLTKEILGAGVPDSILHDLKPKPFSEKIVLDAKSRILLVEIDKIIPHAEKFYSKSNLLEKIFFIFQRIFISTKELAVYYSLPLSSKRVYFYYPVRFISLIYHYTFRYSLPFLYLLIRKENRLYLKKLDFWLIPPD